MVDELVKLIDWANIDNSFVTYDPEGRMVLFFLPREKDTFFGSTNDDFPYIAMGIDPESMDYRIWGWKVPLTTGVLTEIVNGRQTAFLWDKITKNAWIQGQGHGQGTNKTNAAAGTVASASGAVVSAKQFDIENVEPSTLSADFSGVDFSLRDIVITNITPTSPQFLTNGIVQSAEALSQGLKGVRLYLSTAMTNSSGSTFTPSVGVKMALGSVFTKRRTGKLFLGASPKESTRIDWINLYFLTARADANMYVRIFLDGNTTAKSDWNAQSENGVEFIANDSRIIVDLDVADGFVKIPLGGIECQTFELEFELLEPTIDLELLRIEIDGETEEERS